MVPGEPELIEADAYPALPDNEYGFTLSVAGGSQLKPPDSAVRTEKPGALSGQSDPPITTGVA